MAVEIARKKWEREKLNMQKSATKTDIERHIKIAINIKVNDYVASLSRWVFPQAMSKQNANIPLYHWS